MVTNGKGRSHNFQRQATMCQLHPITFLVPLVSEYVSDIFIILNIIFFLNPDYIVKQRALNFPYIDWQRVRNNGENCVALSRQKGWIMFVIWSAIVLVNNIKQKRRT